MNTYPLRVIGKRAETDDAASLILEVPVDLKPAFDYRAGQFITVVREVDGEPVARQYSLSSTPDIDEDLRITVKKVPGGAMSGWLVDTVEVGQTIEVSPPRGRFFVPLAEPGHVLLLAAGSGIAPLYAIARQLLLAGLGHRVSLAYGNRNQDSIILRDDLEQLARRHGDTVFSMEHVLSRPGPGWNGATGHVDPGFLADRLSRWRDASPLPLHIYLCGPEGFMDNARECLVAQGVDANAIRHESFDLILNDDENEPDLIVRADGSEDNPESDVHCERVVACVGGEECEIVPEEGEPILAALLRGGADVPYSCQEGTCSSCISKVTEGVVKMRPIALKTLQQSDLDDGLILACQARPASRTVRIDFDEL